MMRQVVIIAATGLWNLNNTYLRGTKSSFRTSIKLHFSCTESVKYTGLLKVNVQFVAHFLVQLSLPNEM